VKELKMSGELKKVLYIDDEQDILDIVQMCLETIGNLEVTTSTNSKDALSLMNEVRPDLVMLDVMMPESDGPSVLNEIRKHKEFEDIPILFVTARVQTEDIDNYKKLGAASVISKPFDPMEISNEVQEAWREYHDGK
jgi:two-component system OmpR family response regulator